ncbi:unnamed protein product [Cylindrotheca closterium]|uniref:Parahox neighbor n=1 Tax=Cylindrotheca closterium TaxID=2856 RepID=A0AAD2JPA5_9STRA|nr:unnamed protein product [Cylindrotheca closterium]
MIQRTYNTRFRLSNSILFSFFVFFCSVSHLSSTSSFAAAATTTNNDKTCTDPTCKMSKPTPSQLVKLPTSEVVELLSGIYEHSAWVAETLVKSSPLFTDNMTKDGTITVSQLAQAMKEIVDGATEEAKLKLLQLHPDLGVKAATLKTLTKESQEEQGKAGLQTMTPEQLTKFTALNDQYKTTFGFPFILAVRNASKETILAALSGRVNRPQHSEFQTAIDQVHKIAWMRLLSKLDCSTDSEGYLTVHVLDTANGIPAANMKITLTKLSPTVEDLGTFVTNHDGRLDVGPALEGAGRRARLGSDSLDMEVGVYEWNFYAGDYFASQGTYANGTPFLDTIPIRFGIDNPDDHYHVPLLVSPWSFSTYRGS